MGNFCGRRTGQSRASVDNYQHVVFEKEITSVILSRSVNVEKLLDNMLRFCCKNEHLKLASAGIEGGFEPSLPITCNDSAGEVLWKDQAEV